MCDLDIIIMLVFLYQLRHNILKRKFSKQRVKQLTRDPAGVQLPIVLHFPLAPLGDCAIIIRWGVVKRMGAQSKEIHWGGGGGGKV